MPDAPAVELADAIVTRLNTADIANAPTFKRAYRVFFKRDELDEAKGTLIPATQTVEPSSRTKNEEEYEFRIGIHKAVADDLNADEIDDLVKMVGLVVDDLSLRIYTTTNLKANTVVIANEPIYDSKMLEELKVFFSLITVTLRVYR